MKNRIALAVLAALVAAPAMADENSGFYWGFDLGQSSFDLDRNDLDAQIVDSLQQQGLSVLDGRSETSEDGFTWGFTLGYQIFRFLAVEAQYVDLGSAEYKVDALVTDGVNQADVRSGVDIESSGFSVSGLGILPVWDTGWDVYGRAGMYFGSNDAELNVSAGNVNDRLTDDSSSESFFWGAGLGYTRGQWTSRLEYQQYVDVGSEDSGLGQNDVNRIVFSAVYRTDLGAWQRRAPVAAAAAPVVAAAPAAVAPAAPAVVDSDGDGVPDASDRCPNTPAGERVGPNGCSCDVSVQLQFAFNSAELTAADRQLLDQLAVRLNELEFIGGEVMGHTDNIGSDAFNMDLSQRRAQAVLDYLSARGVAPGRMTARGYGLRQPIADNATAEGRALNRRVVIRRTDCGPAG